MAATRTSFTSVQDFVDFTGGNRAISKILIANNGVGAVKAIRSIRKWAYEMFQNERMISFVVMATPEDMRANAEYIRMADEIVDVPGGSNNNNYANVMLIVEIAERWGVDAVWAGWGHASENPLLPDSLEKTDRKIVFIGPSGAPMRALGDKIGSTIIAQSAGVPCIGWNGDGLRCDYRKNGIPDEVYGQANVTSVEACVSECERVGFPIMIKASEGGGGKGIRKVTETSEVPMAFRQVQSEIPGSPIFVMKLAPRARHLEVQLLADSYGTAIALNGRDCSVQRRHQKIIEEGPPVAAGDGDVWKQMENAAVALATEVSYCNAGTVEYLYCYDDEANYSGFYFLELNPRLQVEHPVTEMITHVNLPACQLQVAMGLPLHRIPDIRRLYGFEPFASDNIDFTVSERVPPNNHCIAVRITAENPDQGFKPTSGTIEELNFRSTPDVWGYFSVDSSGLVHEFADSQFGHLFANGSNREAARKNMVMALKELSIRGDIRTTPEFIIEMIESPAFMDNNIDTAWLDARLASLAAQTLERQRPDSMLVVVCGALVTFYSRCAECHSAFLDLVNKGQYPAKDMIHMEMPIDLIYENIKYTLTCAQAGARTFTVACNGTYVEANMRALADGGFLINVGGRSHNAYYTNEASGMRLTLDGQTCIFSKEYDPTRLTTDAAGKFARMLVPEGEHVDAGQPYAEIEVMKMFMALNSGEAGVIRWRMQEGAAMQAGDLLAEMELDHPELVQRAEVFDGVLPEGLSAKKLSQADKPHVILRQALATLDMVMLGFAVPADQFEQAMNDLGDALKNPMLPLLEFQEALSVLNGRIDQGLGEALSALCTEYRAREEAGTAFPIDAVTPLLDAHAATLDDRDRGAFNTQIAALRAVADAYAQGVAGRSVTSLLALVRQYLQVERAFNGLQYSDAVTALRSQHRGDDAAETIYGICRSHASLPRKNALLLALLDHVRTAAEGSKASAPSAPSPTGGLSRGLRSNTSLASLLDVQSSSGAVDMKDFQPVLTELASFGDKAYGVVSLEARRLLIEQTLPSVNERRDKVTTALNAIVGTSSVVGFAQRVEKIDTFLGTNVPVRDVLPEFLSHEDVNMRLATLEVYIRKIYQTHSIRSICGETVPSVAGGELLYVGFEFYTKAAEALPAGTGMAATSSFLNLSQLSAAGASTLNLSAAAPEGGEVSDSTDMEGATYSKIAPNVARHGAFFRASTWEQATADFPAMVGRLPTVGGPNGDLVNCLHLAIMDAPVPLGEDLAEASGVAKEDAFVRLASKFLEQHHDALVAASARRVTFMVFLSPKVEGELVLPSIFTFRARGGFKEDGLFRNIEPSYAFQLDLLRLSNFSIRHCEALQTPSGNVHVYSAMPKRSLAAAAGIKGALSERVFVRVVSITPSYQSTETEQLFVESLNAMELKLAEAEAAGSKKPSLAVAENHIFLNVVAPASVVDPAALEEGTRTLMTRYHDKLTRLGVAHVEFKMTCRLAADQAPMALRVLASNPTGYVLHIELYVERRDASTFLFSSIGKPGIWDGKDVTTPYELVRPFERQRAAALASSDTLYCYDYLELFAAAVEKTWDEYEAKLKGKQDLRRPANLFEAVELVVTKKTGLGAAAEEQWTLADAEAGLLELVQTPRAPGLNDVGMVAWLITLRTPEYPEGRQVVVVSNDITYQHGSFGTREDWVFRAASEYARDCRIPRLYLAANSGARIGIASSVRDKFRVCWNNEEDPSAGFKYLYLTPEDYADLDAKSAAKAKLIYEGEEERYLLTDVIGTESDLGVENLRGSGMIAGETSKAYNDIFTLTLVTGRTVGIGAYLVRLGQRTIQKKVNSPIILTGYQALNKLMGKDIYTTNDQLGGPMIMHPNGVTHVLVNDHLDGVLAAVKWMSYVPSVRGMPLPIVDITGMDMVERPVQWYPKKGEAYDPRMLLTGQESDLDGQWVSGFFDRGSFTETLSGWAKTVIVGRGRLGGIPMGVIVTENRTVECLTPADPADPTSTERNAFQAGGVWFPDSAYKTAQAINDFNSEDLPIIIFANWRGFSGGQRDMFDEVLKFGAKIVDALVAFTQPIFVYIPPFAELRGGAWVVVDSTINPNVMEFFAAENSRGGVLEADALAGIKYRRKDQEKTAHRLDDELIALDAQLAADGLSDEAKADLKDQIRKREAHVIGIYQQISVHFADLHDTPARMEATGVIVCEVPWATSRSYFYWRLRRRLAEFQLRQQIVKYDTADMTAQAASAVIRKWFVESGQPASMWDDSKHVLAWMAEKQYFLREQLEGLRRSSVEKQAQDLAMDCPEAAARGLVQAFQSMDYMQREILRQQLQSIR